MKKYQLVTTPNPILAKVAEKVTFFNDALQNQARQMTEILRRENGVGLAATQVGFANQMFIVEFDDPEKKNSIPLQIFVNPQIVETSNETDIACEGCLSVPNIELPVERPISLKVRAKNLAGKTVKLKAKGLLGRVIVHECDHLQGILFTTRTKEELLKKSPAILKTKIVFIGSGDFAEQILRGLILLDFNILKIITELPKMAGREKIYRPTAVACTAKTFGCDFIETDDVKKLANQIKKLAPDFIVLADFGQIIPDEILNIPSLAAINLHPSLLPKYRGASPISAAILAGVKETGITLIKMAAKVDAGEILTQESLTIFKDDTTASLKIRLANLALQILIKYLPQIIQGQITPVVQDESKATYTHRLKKTNGEINWQDDAQKIERQIRAYYPWPGSYATIDNKRLIIHRAHLDGNKLIPDVVQPQGKKTMTWQDFLRGYKGPKPAWFSKIN